MYVVKGWCRPDRRARHNRDHFWVRRRWQQAIHRRVPGEQMAWSLSSFSLLSLSNHIVLCRYSIVSICKVQDGRVSQNGAYLIHNSRELEEKRWRTFPCSVIIIIVLIYKSMWEGSQGDGSLALHPGYELSRIRVKRRSMTWIKLLLRLHSMRQ